MNFSILNFKRQARFWGAVAITVSLLAIADLALLAHVRARSTVTRFIDNKESKFRHFLLQDFSSGLDAVFVGSSLTKNHVSTAEFRELGWSVYNMGISGRLLADFPSMLNRALMKSPRLVVLNISAAELFQEPQSDFVHFDDLKMHWRAGLPPAELLTSAASFLLSLHKLHYYREPLYEQIKGVAMKIVPKRSGEAVEEQNRYPAHLAQLKEKPDCRVFKRATYERMEVVTCENGDGIQLGNFSSNHDTINKVPSEARLNEGALSLLTELVREGEARSKIVVVLQPSLGAAPAYDLSMLQARLGVPLIDLSREVLSEADWCDGGHFNIYGRKKYSLLLEERLRPYLARN